MPVRMLDNETIGKIAAGEVVERPMSVVKELIENALDADATRISVEIANGGVDLIRVTDNGSGMSPADLELAVKRHATSKLATFEDLEHLHTLGFRGEALPSIGSVSVLEIRTTQRGSSSGNRLLLEYGVDHASENIATPPGTSVSVRDLFGNVPARRKFLRQSSTESSYISRLVGAYACNRPDVSWSFANDGRKGFSTGGNGVDEDAAVGVYGHELASELLVLEPLPADMAVAGIDVGGWVSSPQVTRSHRQNLFFFINGRLATHRSLVFALEEAFHSLLMVGRHPIGVVRVDLDPAQVDVNVHPTKAEVKFVDERSVCRAIQRTTHQALTGQRQDAIPHISFAPAPATAPMDLVSIEAFPERSSSASANQVDPEPVRAHSSGVPILRVLGQVSGTYVIAEGPSGMFLIDQHAAHERVLYEKIMAEMASGSVNRQPLLDPLIVDLSPDEMAILEKSIDELTQIGFDLAPFGAGAIAIRQIPAICRGVDIAERLHLILGELADGGAGDSWIDSVAISAACHTSIRAGQALSLAEMRELVAQLERTRQPRACGHGRPTMLHMTQLDLEKQFARR